MDKKQVLIFRQSEAAGSSPWKKTSINKSESIESQLEYLESIGSYAMGENYRGIEGFIVEEELADIIISEEKRKIETRRSLTDQYLKELNRARGLESVIEGLKEKIFDTKADLGKDLEKIKTTIEKVLKRRVKFSQSNGV